MSGVATIYAVCYYMYTMSSLAPLRVCDPKEQKLTESRNARSEQLLVMPTEQLTENKTARRALEPLGETSARREADRDRAGDRRLNGSLEETAARRQVERDRAADRRINDTLEETAAQCQVGRNRAADSGINETVARREIERLSAANCRVVAKQQRNASSRHDVCDQRRLAPPSSKS